MKIAAIYLFGIPNVDKPQAIKTVKYEDEKDLITELKKLQDGYCEGEKPKITKYQQMENGKLRKVIDCFCSVDFHYAALLGMRVRPEAGKPVEILGQIKAA